jgi:hypothetical protein
MNGVMKSSDADILAQVIAAFRACLRPEHFTDYAHCEECAEHDEVLRSRDVESLTRADAGQMGWDPMTFSSEAGVAYYFPALARLTLEGESDLGWYGPQLLWHLSYEGSCNRFLSYFSSQQIAAVCMLLRQVEREHAELVEANLCAEDLQSAISIWECRDESR